VLYYFLWGGFLGVWCFLFTRLLKMEQSITKRWHMRGNHPKERIRHTQYGESLKLRKDRSLQMVFELKLYEENACMGESTGRGNNVTRNWQGEDGIM
jgi:hypothetical protein